MTVSESNFKIIVGFILLFVSGCGVPPADEQNQIEQSSAPNTMLKSTYDAPTDWEKSAGIQMTAYNAPEKDASLIIIPIANAKNAEAAAKAAWAMWDPNFTREIRLNSPAVSGKGWEVIREIEYLTSPSEKKLAYAYVHGLKNQWQVVLLDGHLPTFAKRGAAARGVIQSFAVEGFESEDLSGRTANDLTEERVDAFRSFLAESAASLSIPGVGFALIQNGEVVYEGGVGVKTFGNDEPVNKNTRFMIASNTKGMTTLLLAKLVDMGKLNWDDPVIDHYPAFKLGDKTTTESVLIRHLVCACTGLPRKDFDWVFRNSPETSPTVTFEDLAATSPTSGFGELYQYNNQMAAAAGFVAGHIMYPEMEIGAAYDKAMQSLIFDPLKMDNTTFSFAEVYQGDFASPHVVDIQGNIEVVEQSAQKGFNHTIVAYRPAGAAWSTPRDMIRYIQNELSQGVAPDGTRLFAAETLLERRKPSVSSGKNRAYGMGLATKKISGIELVEHGGSMAGYLSQMAIIPSANTGAVILTNSDEGHRLLSPASRRLVEILYDAPESATKAVAVAAELQQSSQAKTREALTIPADPDVISKLAAYYYNEALGPLDVKQQNGQTILDPGVWSSTVATKPNPDGTISLALTNRALQGTELLVGEANGKRTLTLIDAQHSYVFSEVEEVD